MFKIIICVLGVGLYGGVKVNMVLCLVVFDIGIVFCCVDLLELVDICVDVFMVGDICMCFCLEKDGVKVGIIEYLMLVFVGFGIDNVWVDLDVLEVFIFDGLVLLFVFFIQLVGIEEQNVVKKFICVIYFIEVCEGDKWVCFEFYDGYCLFFLIVFNYLVIDKLV